MIDIERIKEIFAKEGITKPGNRKKHPNRIAVDGNCYKRLGIKDWAELKIYLSREYPELKEFFEEFPSSKIASWALTHSLKEAPKCPYCDKPLAARISSKLDYEDPLSMYNHSCGDPACMKKAQQAAFVRNLGVDNPSRSKECLEKRIVTWVIKYGVDNPTKSKLIQKKIEETDRKNHGGIRAAQTVEFQEKRERTNLSKYGKKYYAQTREYHQRSNKKYKYKNMPFDSSWEIYVYIYCEDYNITIENKPDPIPYIDSFGIDHLYHPDFRINGELVEVKGDQFIDTDGSLTLNIYKEANLRSGTEEDWERKEAAMKAKSQCMEENGIKILTTGDIKKYKEYVDSKYGKNYIQQFRNY